MRERSHSRGLTLIELIVAIAIAAVLFGGVVTGVGAITGANAKQAAGELAGTIRSVYDTAAISGRTCRLVFELPPERDEDGGAVSYRAECAASAVTTRRDREAENREATDAALDKSPPRARRYGSGDPSLEDLAAAEEERIEKAAAFAEFTDEEVRTRTLPSNVRLHLWTRHQTAPTTSGKAFLYFFPQGHTEKAQLYVRQGDNTWTITVAPLTGKTVVYAEELEVPKR